jgi:hypothetical protein
VQLSHTIENAPRNGQTGEKELMLTVFDHSQLILTRNLLCSSRLVGLKSNYHIFVAFDEIALSGLLPLNPLTLLCNVSGRGFGYHEFCRLKLLVQIIVLRAGIVVTICDTDVVILRDPRELFVDDAHFEAMIEYAILEIDGKGSGPFLNVGFMRTIPSVMTLTLFENWARNTMNPMKALEQDVLHQMLGSYKSVVKQSITMFNLSQLGINNELLRLRYFAGEFVQNGDMILNYKKVYSERARSRNVHEPYVCHLSYVPASDKIPTFMDWGLWFLGAGNHTCGCVPDKRVYADWRGYPV